MGGRGGTSGLSKNEITDKFKSAGVPFVEDGQLDKKAVEKALKGVYDVMTDMGIPLSALRMIAGRNNIMGDGFMAVNGFMDLQFSNNVYSSLENAERKNKENQGAVSNNIYGTGAHEAGHIVIREIINRTMKDSTNLQKADAWQKGKIEKQVIKEAKKKYGSNPVISRYGSTKPAEKVAEAVSDVYSNKSKANPYSKAIVDVLKRKLKGG